MVLVFHRDCVRNDYSLFLDAITRSLNTVLNYKILVLVSRNGLRFHTESLSKTPGWKTLGNVVKKIPLKITDKCNMPFNVYFSFFLFDTLHYAMWVFGDASCKVRWRCQRCRNRFGW